VFYIPLAYTAPAWRDGSAAGCRRAGCDKPRSPLAYARFRPLVSLCARSAPRLAMPAILKSQRVFLITRCWPGVSSGAPVLLTVIHAALGTGRPIVDAED
jgi:hypothetical protein